MICMESVAMQMKHFCSIFERIREAGLNLKLRKCVFAVSEVRVLGDVIFSKGIKADPCKQYRV